VAGRGVRVVERLTEWNELPGGFAKFVEKFFEVFSESIEKCFVVWITMLDGFGP
jgi:hypothetical protein